MNRVPAIKSTNEQAQKNTSSMYYKFENELFHVIGHSNSSSRVLQSNTQTRSFHFTTAIRLDYEKLANKMHR